MKRLLLSLLLAAAPALAKPPVVQVYTARAEGNLIIGADGRVLDVELASDANLGTGVLEGYEQRVRGWRFEPIIEDGVAVNVKGRLQLSLVAAREKGNPTATFGIRGVQFLDPAPTSAPAEAPRLAQPGYPDNAFRAGAGARVTLLVKIDGQGRPAQVTTERLELLGVATGQSHQRNLATQFRRSAEQVAAKWTFSGHAEGELLRVPVWYTTEQWAKGWVPTTMQVVDLPEWAELELAKEQATDLIAGGAATAARFKLLTPLDGA